MKICILYFLLCTTLAQGALFIFDPAGDVNNPGRLIANVFERTATSDLARTLSQRLNSTHKNISVMLTRQPGSAMSNQDKIRLVEQKQPILFLRLAIYQSKTVKPTLGIYHDSLKRPIDEQRISLLYKALGNNTERFFELYKPEKASLNLLNDISCTGCIIEIGVRNISELTYVVEPLVTALLHII